MADREEKRLYELDHVSSELRESVPPHIRESIDNYVWHGRPTGGFVAAVLRHDLMDAVGRADQESIEALQGICQYVYNAVPSICCGSRQAVADHIRLGRVFQIDRE